MNDVASPIPGQEMGREYAISFVLSIMASVVAYYICKWLDGNE